MTLTGEEFSVQWDILVLTLTLKRLIYSLREAGELQIVKDGTATDYSEEKATEILSQNPVIAIADVKQGDASATAWGCDLTFDYVKINADYRS